MKTMKILILAGLTVLSLGAGAAMAQSESNGNPGVPYWTLERQAQALHLAQARNSARIQSGASDIAPAQGGAVGHVLPFSANSYGTLANPG